MSIVNAEDLRERVIDMYRDVAREPGGAYRFELDPAANPAYRFPSPRARAAVEKYDVTSVTVLAVKPG